MTDAGSRTMWMALCAVALASLFCIWWPGFPTGTDMPTHLMTAELLAHPDRLSPWLSAHYPPTSQLSVWVTVPLVLVLPVPIAGLVSLTLFASIAACCAAWLARELNAPPAWGAVVALSQFFGFGFAMGFTNFLLGNALGMALIAAAIHAVRHTGRQPLLVVCGLAMLCAHAHIIAFGMFAAQWLLIAVVATLAGLREPEGPWRWPLRRAMLVSACFIPAGLMTLVILAGIRQPLAADFDQEMVQGLRLTLRQLALGLVDFGPGGWSVAAWALLPAWLIAVVAGLRQATVPGRWIVALTVVCWVGVYLAVPFHLGGWAFASPRALPLLWAMPLLLLPTPKSAPVILTYAAAAVIVLGATGVAQRPAADTLRVIVADLVADEPPGRAVVVREPLPTGARSEWIEPYHHAASYAVARGGMMQHMMRWNPWMHSVTPIDDGTDWLAVPPEFIHRSLRCAPGPACDEQWLRLADRTALQALAFDAVITPSVEHRLAARLAERGFAPVAPDVHRPVAHTVQFSAANPDPDAATVTISWPESLGPLGRLSVNPESLRAGVQLGPLPAGPALLTVEAADGRPLVRLPFVVAPDAPTTTLIAP